MIAALVIAVVIAAACVILVALPFIREPATPDDHLESPGELSQRRLALAEERDRALVGPLRRRAAEAVRALEPRTQGHGTTKVASRG